VSGPADGRRGPAVLRLRAGHSLGRGVLSSATYGVSSMLAGLALLPIVIDRVGAAPYGIWLLISSLTSYLYQADLGMGAAIVHFLARDRERAEAEERRRLVTAGFAWMSGAATVALPVYLAFAILLVHGRSGSYLTGADRVTLIGLGGLLVALLGFRVFPSALQGTGHWVFERSTQVVGVGVRIVGTLIGCYVIRGVVPVAIAESLSDLVPMMLATAACLRLGLRPRRLRSVTRAEMRTLLSYSVRAFTVGAMAAILLQADTLIVGIVASAAAVTYYTAGFRVYSGIRQLLSWLTDPLLPSLSRLFATDREAARSMTLGMLFISLWTAAGACGTIIVGARFLVRVWLGDSVPTDRVAAVIAILLVGLIVNSVHIAGIAATDASGRPGAFLPLHMIWCASNLILSVGLGLTIGIPGVAVGTTLPLLVLEPFYVRRMTQTLQFRLVDWWRACLRPTCISLGFALLATLAVAAALGRAPWHVELVGSVAFALGYAASAGLQRRRFPTRHLATAAAARM
jgi:O-antigen/teichoic acid export membrane protein